MLRAMEPHGGPFRRPSQIFGSPRVEIDFSGLPTADPSAFASLREDERFIGPARSHRFAVALYVRELQELLPVVDSIVGLIDQTLDAP